MLGHICYYVYGVSAITLIHDISFIAPMCHCMQYILTQSYQTQLSCASYYIPVYHDKLLVTNTNKYTEHYCTPTIAAA